jgi:L-threonylcarbamoyladenylate synthase
MESSVKGTRVLRVNRENPPEGSLQIAADILRSGGLVAFPTETVYGLGADTTNAEAVRKIFKAKDRPGDNPLIVHVADVDDVSFAAAVVPAPAQALMEKFWPGPLTLVLPRSDRIADVVSCGLPTVAVRMPDHPVARALIRAAGVPLAAPSANLSGRPSPTTAEHVLEDLAGRIDCLIDAGETGIGVESTIIDLTVDPPALLRPGGITPEQICAVIGPVFQGATVSGQVELGEQPKAPGMKYSHYAPIADLVLVEGAPSRVAAKINDLIVEYSREGRRVGVMATAENRGAYMAHVVLEVGSMQRPATIATALFATLRAFDRHKVDVVLAEGIPPKGIGLAVMNRLRKAAGGRVIEV